MGEIRVKVRLTNSVDEGLVRRGQLPADQVRSVEVEAVVDTGAIQSVVPAALLEPLGVEVRGRRTAQYANNSTESVGLTEALLFEVLGRETFEEAMVLGDEVLIGQTVLEKLDLLADCPNQQVIPNPKHPDGPVSMIR